MSSKSCLNSTLNKNESTDQSEDRLDIGSIYGDIAQRFELLKSKDEELRIRAENLEKRETIIAGKIGRASKLKSKKKSQTLDSTTIAEGEQKEYNLLFDEMDKMVKELKNVRSAINSNLKKAENINMPEFSTLCYQAGYYVADYISGGN